MAEVVNNYVNFLTMDIDPVALNEYLDSVSGAGKGSDESTAGYTKFAWTLLVAEKMFNNGTITQDIKDVIDTYGSNLGIHKGVLERSVEGLNLLQMISLYHINDKDYDFSSIISVWPTFAFEVKGQQSDLSMINILAVVVNARQFNQASFIYALDNTTNHTLAHEYETHGISAYLLAISMYANGNDEALDTLRTLSPMSQLDTRYYGKINKDGELSKTVENKLASVLMQLNTDSLERALLVQEVITTINNEDSSSYTSSTVTRSDGLSDGDIAYDGGTFEGYGFAHMMKMKFGAEACMGQIGSKMLSFSSYGGMLSAGSIDGVSLYAIETGEAKINDNGHWNFTPLTKPNFDEADTTLNYAKYGNVRDITKGGKINFFGPVTNILLEFKGYHTFLYGETDKSVAATSMPGIEDVFREKVTDTFLKGITYAFYVKWLTFFNLEIQ